MALECDHCGGDPIEANADGLYWDGDGGRCRECGYPGCVVVEAPDAFWVLTDEADASCGRGDCKECVPSRWERFAWWFRTRILRRCYGCGIRMLPEGEDDDPRIEAGTHSTLHPGGTTGRWCYSCVEYGDG